VGNGELGQARGAMDVKLAHEQLTMRFDGTRADVQAAGNFLVAETFGDAGQDFALTIREIGQVASLRFNANQAVEGHAGNVWREEGLAAVNRLYGLNEFAPWVRGRHLHGWLCCKSYRMPSAP